MLLHIVVVVVVVVVVIVIVVEINVVVIGVFVVDDDAVGVVRKAVRTTMFQKNYLLFWSFQEFALTVVAAVVERAVNARHSVAV